MNKQYLIRKKKKMELVERQAPFNNVLALLQVIKEMTH